METLSDILDRERRLSARFFGAVIDVPPVPGWISETLSAHWQRHRFDIRYLPPFAMDEGLALPAWKDRPGPAFFRVIRPRLSSPRAAAQGHWMLVDARDRPARRVPWIRSTETQWLERFGLRVKDVVKRWTRQAFDDEYLDPALRPAGFGSRFGLSVRDVDRCKPFIRSFLKLDSARTVRLPFFSEYNYLANAAYPPWSAQTTWEWLEDRTDGGDRLVVGGGSAGCVGWEAPEFWSSILAFRPFVEL